MTDHTGDDLNPRHWEHYTTDALAQLIDSLEAMEQQPSSTIAAVKAELERRREPA